MHVWTFLSSDYYVCDEVTSLYLGADRYAYKA